MKAVALKIDNSCKEVELESISDDISYGYTASSTQDAIGPKMLRITDIQENQVVWDEVPYCEIDDSIKGKYLLKPNDIVFARTGATVGKSFLITGNIPESVFASYLIRVRLKKNIEPKYVSYFFHTIDYWHQIRMESSGIGQPNVNGTKLKKIRLPLVPLEQQKQIVAKIEELFSHIDAGIDALKQSHKLLTQYRQSVLKAAVTGELSKEWREQNKSKLEPASKLLERILHERRQKWEAQQLEQFKAKGKMPKDDGWKAKYKEPSAPDAEGFPEIPEEWIWSGFEQVASPEKNSMKAGPFGSALKKQFYTESGYKIYGQEQVINGDPYYGDYYISEDKYQSLISCAIKPGDFLISLVGTIGKILVLPEDCEPGIINPRLIKITFDKNICSPNYAKIYVSSPVVKGIFSLSSHGGTMDVLNMNSLKSLPFPLPSLYEQKNICVEVDRIFTVIESMEKTIDFDLKRSERLKKSVLQSAFGEGL